MHIASKEIINDASNPSQELMIIQLIDTPKIEDIESTIDQFQAEEWAYQSYFFHSTEIAYITFVRPTKNEIDWYGKLVTSYPEKLFGDEEEEIVTGAYLPAGMII